MEKLKNSFNENRTVWITWLSALAPLFFLAVIFKKIPEQIPVSFDESGKVIGYDSKYSIHMLIQSSLGVIAAITMSVLMRVVMALNFRPDRKNYDRFVEVMKTIVMIITMMFAFSSIMILVKFL